MLPLLTAVLLGCGGGSGGSAQPAVGPAPPPTVQGPAFDLVFPGAESLTDASQVTIVGTTEANQVSAVTIKSGAIEIVAALDTDGRWRADAVPLQPGANSLVAEFTETDGEVTERAIAAVQSSPILSSPSGVTFDSVNNRVYIADAKQLLAFDPVSGVFEVTSSARIGAGPAFGFARHLAMAGDNAVLVSDITSVRRVDPVSGDRTDHVVYPAGAFPGSSIARDKQRNRLFTLGLFKDLNVADLNAPPPITAMPVRPVPPFGLSSGSLVDAAYVAGTDTVYAVDFTVGAWAIDATIGDPQFLTLDTGGVQVGGIAGIDYEEIGDRLLLLGSFGTVLSLDPVTGASNVLTNAPAITSGANNGLTQGDGRLWTVSPVPGRLVSVDPSSGSQTIEVQSVAGSGVRSGFMLAGRFDAAADRFIAVSDLRVIAIDPQTGSRELIVDLFASTVAGAFGQPRFVLLSGMALSQDGTRVWLTDPFPGALAEVNLNTGAVDEIWVGDAASAGPLDQIAGLAVNPEETTAYVGDRFAGRIYRIDLLTGQRDVLTDFSANLGPTVIRTLVLDTNANRLILDISPFSPASTVDPAIYALDLGSFELTLLANLAAAVSPFGAISAPGFPTTQMSLNADGTSLFYPVSGNPDVPYLRIDLVLGTFVPLGDATSGPPFFLPTAIDGAPDGRLFALDGTSALHVIEAKTGERVIVSK